MKDMNKPNDKHCSATTTFTALEAPSLYLTATFVCYDSTLVRVSFKVLSTLARKKKNYFKINLTKYLFSLVSDSIVLYDLCCCSSAYFTTLVP